MPVSVVAPASACPRKLPFCAKNRPFVFCVMTTFLREEAEGERAIEEIARSAYEYYSRLGYGPLGRRIGD